MSLAWEAFREGNGVRSLLEMRGRIAKYRRVLIEPTENPMIGCILLAEPFFFREAMDSYARGFQSQYCPGKGL